MLVEVEVCQRWEEEFFKVQLPDTRQVLFRIGFALGRNGGALRPLQKMASFNLGGTVGTGKQYISWLQMEDLNAMFLYAIESERFSGIYNATGPQPVTNKEFMKTLRACNAQRLGATSSVSFCLVWRLYLYEDRAEPCAYRTELCAGEAGGTRV